MSRQPLFPFWKDKALTPEEQNGRMVAACRKVFSGEDGKIVLNMLLTDLKVFEDSRTKRDHALNEYGKFFIRRRLGVDDTKDITDFIAETASGGGGI
jgi:hypothetical protein